MSTTLFQTTLHNVECRACRRGYAINAQMREAGGSWRCPYLDCSSGSWHRAERSREELLKDQLDASQKEVERQKENSKFWQARKEETALERDHFRKSRDGIRGALTKVKKRVSAGVCPCCNRSFPNDKMARHLATKHPKFSCVAEERP